MQPTSSIKEDKTPARQENQVKQQIISGSPIKVDSMKIIDKYELLRQQIISIKN